MTLSQIDNNGMERVIAYNGRCLNQAERNYSTTDRELLAIIKGVKKYQCYLYGKKFTIHVDHSALQYLRSVKNPVGRIARWICYLQEFEFNVVYRKGKTHLNADSLSRREYQTSELYAMNSMNISSTNDSNDDDIRKIYMCQRRDRDLEDIINYLETNQLPSNNKLARKVLLSEDLFYLSDKGLLYRLDHNDKSNEGTSLSRLVIPQPLRFEIMYNAHDQITGGHFGTKKTYRKLKKKVLVERNV